MEAEVLPRAARKMLITHQRLCPMVTSALRLESEMVRKRPNHESNVVGWEVGSVADNPSVSVQTLGTCLIRFFFAMAAWSRRSVASL